MRNPIYRFIHSQLTSGPVSRFVGSLLGNPLRHRGFRIRCPEDTNPRVKVSLRTGLYEVTEVKFIEQYLPARLDCLEMGASIGVTGCHIRKHLDADRSLVSVEAMPDLAALARVNLNCNHPDAKWDLIQAAIWYGADAPRMRIGNEHTQGRLDADGESGHTVVVPAVKLADLYSHIGGEPYSLVADIEGAEFDMIAHDKSVLSDCHVAIIELHGSPERCQQFVDDMDECGLKVMDQKRSVWVFGRELSPLPVAAV
jgi:FkbM family methyltransferase